MDAGAGNGAGTVGGELSELERGRAKEVDLPTDAGIAEAVGVAGLNAGIDVDSRDGVGELFSRRSDAWTGTPVQNTTELYSRRDPARPRPIWTFGSRSPNLVIASFLSRDDFVILRFLTKEISVRSSQTLATAVSPASSSFQNLYGGECGRKSARAGLQNSGQTLRDPIRGVETWTTADDTVPSLSLSSP